MPKSSLAPSTSGRWLVCALTFAAIASASPLATAGKLAPLEWASDPIVSPSVVDNGQLETSAPVLGSRSSKQSGGYVLNPVCLTESGTIVTGLVEYKYSKWRVKCPDSGKAVLNGSDYTTEDKTTVVQRGGLSPATVVFDAPGARRVLCYGKLGNGQTLPGQMDIPVRGTVPDKCRVQVMGNMVALTDWGVFKYKNTELPGQDGWWSPGDAAKPSNTEIPLYAYHAPKLDELCRAKEPGTNLQFPGELIRSTSKYQCRINTPSGLHTVDDFEVYVAHTKNGRPYVSTVANTKATQPWSSGVVFHDGGSDATRVYACKIAGRDQLGWVKKSEGLCHVYNNQAATSFKLLMN